MDNSPVSEIVVMAVGGNALAPSGLGEFAEQMERARNVAGHAVALLDGGRRLVVVHGNGPQVGALALAQEAVAREVPPQPLHVLGAMTQGQLGFMLGQAIGDELEARGHDRAVAAIVTQVVVDRADPGFSTPTKPIGPFFSAGRAKRLAQARGMGRRRRRGPRLAQGGGVAGPDRGGGVAAGPRAASRQAGRDRMRRGRHPRGA